MYVFEVKETNSAICYDLWPWPFNVMTFVKSHFCIVLVINGQNIASFQQKIAWVRAFK